MPDRFGRPQNIGEAIFGALAAGTSGFGATLQNRPKEAINKLMATLQVQDAQRRQQESLLNQEYTKSQINLANLSLRKTIEDSRKTEEEKAAERGRAAAAEQFAALDEFRQRSMGAGGPITPFDFSLQGNTADIQQALPPDAQLQLGGLTLKGEPRPSPSSRQFTSFESEAYWLGEGDMVKGAKLAAQLRSGTGPYANPNTASRTYIDLAKLVQEKISELEELRKYGDKQYFTEEDAAELELLEKQYDKYTTAAINLIDLSDDTEEDEVEIDLSKVSTEELKAIVAKGPPK